MSASSIISQVQINDLAQEETRIVQEREDRRLLRIASPSQMNITELIKEMSSSTGDKVLGDIMEVPKGEADEGPPTDTAFPAPPAGPVSNPG